MLRERYERMRERALIQADGWGLTMSEGMRSWIEAGGSQPGTFLTPARHRQHQPYPERFQQIVALWASVLVSQAERNEDGQRQRG